MINLNDISVGYQKEIWHPCIRQLGFRTFPSAKRLKVLEITQNENFHLLKVFDDVAGKYTLSLETNSGMVDDFYYTEEAALKVSTMRFYEKRFEAEKKSVPYVGLGIISLLVIMSFIALST